MFSIHDKKKIKYILDYHSLLVHLYIISLIRKFYNSQLKSVQIETRVMTSKNFLRFAENSWHIIRLFEESE